ncbi:MAG: MotA/TolQ/ExbB proton channel family protein [Flavobacteriaceae bacterium]
MMDVVETLRSFLALGGPVVALLLLLSLVALAAIVFKLQQFFAERVGRHGAARRAVAAWRQGRVAEARATAEEDQGVVGACLAAAMSLASRRAARPEIEEEIVRIATGRLHELQRGFRLLDAISQIAPLLGLFGTVLGMIEAFQQLQTAGNAVDPSILAGGIWVALLTTAVGLAVAMPVSLVLTWFETRLENERVAVETLTAALFSPQESEAAAAPSAIHAEAGPRHAR